MFTSLPKDVRLRVLSLLAKPADLSRIGRVSKALHRLVHNSPSLWKEIAERKYGRDLAQCTIYLYDNDWEKMMRDDNRKGALLAVTRTAVPSEMWKSNYRFNRDNYYFCCLLTGLKYDRLKKMLYLYLDVRGEDDLRHPSSSFFVWTSQLTNKSWYSFRVQNYVSFLETQQRDHHKCVVSVDIRKFPASKMDGPGTWSFVFASRYSRCDYQPIPLFVSDQGQSIESIIPTLQCFHYFRRDFDREHPFTDDTEEIERKRWQSHVPQRVLDRTTPTRWWV